MPQRDHRGAPAWIQPSFEELGEPLISTPFVVVDLETTGLRPSHDHITEIGAIKVLGGEVVGELATLVRPPVAIPASIVRFTGISDLTVQGAPQIDDIATTVFEFLGSCVFVAHNARFDLAFLQQVAQEHLQFSYQPLVFDTARLARRLLRNELPNMRLATLAYHLQTTTRPSHRAMADAKATVEIFHRLLERAGGLGATTVEDLRELLRSRSDRRFRRIRLVQGAPNAAGVYRFVSASGDILYVGKATDLRQRLRSYFGQDDRRMTEQLVRETARVDWTVTTTVLEAEIHELRQIQRLRPQFNRRSIRPTAARWLALTDEPFPRLAIVGAPRADHRWSFGPFSSRQDAEAVRDALRDYVGLRDCTTRLRAAQDHASCVLHDLGRCGAVCDGSESRQAYERRLDQLERATREPDDMLERLRQRMTSAAANEQFETATDLRQTRHRAARALLQLRRRTALSAPPRCVVRVLQRTGAEHAHDEVYDLRHGHLRCSLIVDPDTSDDGIMRQLDAAPPLLDCDALVITDPLAELALVLAALERGHVRVVYVDGTWVEPVSGGALLSAIERERQAVQNAVNRDQWHVRQQATRSSIRVEGRRRLLTG